MYDGKTKWFRDEETYSKKLLHWKKFIKLLTEKKGSTGRIKSGRKPEDDYLAGSNPKQFCAVINRAIETGNYAVIGENKYKEWRKSMTQLHLEHCGLLTFRSFANHKVNILIGKVSMILSFCKISVKLQKKSLKFLSSIILVTDILVEI